MQKYLGRFAFDLWHPSHILYIPTPKTTYRFIFSKTNQSASTGFFHFPENWKNVPLNLWAESLPSGETLRGKRTSFQHLWGFLESSLTSSDTLLRTRYSLKMAFVVLEVQLKTSYMCIGRPTHLLSKPEQRWERKYRQSFCWDKRCKLELSPTNKKIWSSQMNASAKQTDSKR